MEVWCDAINALIPAEGNQLPFCLVSKDVVELTSYGGFNVSCHMKSNSFVHCYHRCYLTKLFFVSVRLYDFSFIEIIETCNTVIKLYKKFRK